MAVLSSNCRVVKQHLSGFRLALQAASHKPVRTLFLIPLILVELCFIPGCGKGSGKAAVSGEVNFKNGELINRGTIEFAPFDASTKDQTGARIVDGTYEISGEKGLRPGKYVVRIYSPSALLSGDGAPGAGPMALPEERVSEQFNSKSTLLVEVTSDSAHRFDFEVE